MCISEIFNVKKVANSNEYQLRLERKRQVWFIPLVDEGGVCR